MQFTTWIHGAIALFFCLAAATATADVPIRLNSMGFLPARPKQATLAMACTDFTVVRVSDGTVAFRGRATGPITNPDTGEALYTADFTALKAPGEYRLEAPGAAASAPFRIAPDLYIVPFEVVTRAMYLWRCGTAVRAEYNGVTYAHGACHLEDAWMDYVGGGHNRHESTKGWHDAGDYNKYVVNAGITVGLMLRAWELYGARIGAVPLGIPGEPALPEYLREIRWELDWLLTMQAPDGSVYHKLSTRNFGPSGPPEKERTERYLTPWSSAATADFVAMLAQAARVFRRYDAPYARRCLEAATKSYAFLSAHPENHPADLKGFSTGGYQTQDPDDRVWAAAEMWETTGRTDCLADFETRARALSGRIDADYGWGNVRNMGMLTYLFSRKRGRSEALLAETKAALRDVADGLVRTRQAHGYARPLGSTYYWGANGTVAAQAVLLQAAHRLFRKQAYADTALDAVGHLFGRNIYGRSFVTGLGDLPPLHPHDRRSMGQRGAPTWPGSLVGGGWPRAADWKDAEASYQTNEIAINWNAPLICALAALLPEPASR